MNVDESTHCRHGPRSSTSVTSSPRPARALLFTAASACAKDWSPNVASSSTLYATRRVRGRPFPPPNKLSPEYSMVMMQALTARSTSPGRGRGADGGNAAALPSAVISTTTTRRSRSSKTTPSGRGSAQTTNLDAWVATGSSKTNGRSSPVSRSSKVSSTRRIGTTVGPASASAGGAGHSTGGGASAASGTPHSLSNAARLSATLLGGGSRGAAARAGSVVRPRWRGRRGAARREGSTACGAGGKRCVQHRGCIAAAHAPLGAWDSGSGLLRDAVA